MVAQASRLCIFSIILDIEPGVILPMLGQFLLYRITQNILPFFQKLYLIPNDAVIALILANGSLAASRQVNFVDAEALDAMDDLCQVINTLTFRQGKGVHQGMHMIWNDDRGM